MHYIYFFILTGMITFSGLQAQDNFQQEAMELLGPIKKAFMKELKVGMQKGPYNAIDSCHLKAPHLIEHDKSPKYEFGRTSNKIRNYQNEPKKWMVKILAEFAETKAKDQKAPQVYTLDNKKKVYVEPIYIKAVCLNCHGSPKGSVSKRLKKLYPKDQATGYKVGDFRGLFWVKQR
ncbi:DUF3365 domain-containing protein [Bacteriovoracaceae bacterium]|nr:DUF3365 domain-containing protein [Bacteriovoracaceae bacterium]